MKKKVPWFILSNPNHFPPDIWLKWKIAIQCLVVQFIDQKTGEGRWYVELMKHPALLSVLPHIPLHIWPMAQIVLGSRPYYVAAHTSYTLNLDHLLRGVLPYCAVLDISVETTTGVYFVGQQIS